MSWIQALILGLVQGLTEFLPVSSSAHLKLAKRFLGIADGEHLLFFDLVCHAGTWLALVLYLRRDIWDVLRSPNKIALFSAALFPLVPAYFLLKPLRIALSDPSYLGFFLILTSGLLFAATRKEPRVQTAEGGTAEGAASLFSSQRSCDPRLSEPKQNRSLEQSDKQSDRARHCLESKASEKDRFGEGAASLFSSQRSCDPRLSEPKQNRSLEQSDKQSDRARHCLESKASEKDRFGEGAASPKKYKDVLCIGGMQALALIPGISRSGSTIAAARMFGWEWREAARFSFLLAVPTVLGGQLLETAKVLSGHSDAAGVSLGCYAAGFAAAFGLGIAGVRFVFRIYEKGNVRPFVWYCLGVGILAIAIFHG